MKKLTGSEKCYLQRDRNLRKLGFSTYREYLQSDLWKDIRTEVLEKNKHKCFFCGCKAFEVHHLWYSLNTLSRVNEYYINGLKAICRNCHQYVFEYARDNKIKEAYAFNILMMVKKKSILFALK